MNKKNLLFAFIAASAGLLAQSQRLVLIEEFTQASCGPCASQNPAFNTLLNANTTKAVGLKYQVNWPGSDPMNAQNPTEVANRVAYYGVTGVPYALTDGGAGGAPSTVTQTTINNEYAVPSPFAIDLKYWFNAANDSVYVNCEVTCSQNVTMTKPYLRIAMIEKLITFTSPPGSNGEKVFEHVMRKMYPNANGTSVQTTWTAGQKLTISFKEKIPAYIYKKTEIAMVAFVQDDGNKNVKQAAFASSPSAPLALPPVAQFSSDVINSCDGIVSFKDNSALFPTGWLWDFGDGTTSNLQNPVHKYFNQGTYTVKLTASNANGSNQASKTSYITVALSGNAPSGVNDNVCVSGVAYLSATASGGGTLDWYNASGVKVNTGATYSPNITGTTDFYVCENIPNPVQTIGAPDNNIGAGAYFTANNTHGMYFDVAKPCVLTSVVCYANTAGSRTIDVLDAGGAVIQTKAVNMTAGQNLVQLNFALPAGSGFLIKISSATVDLYRNSAGAVFPYTNSVLTITGSTATTNPTYYYYFYDWKVQQNPCKTPTVKVSGIDTCTAVGVNNFEVISSLNVYPNPAHYNLSVQFSLAIQSPVLIELVNAVGEVVLSENMNNTTPGTHLVQFNTEKLSSGMYFVNVKTETGVKTVKVSIR